MPEPADEQYRLVVTVTDGAARLAAREPLLDHRATLAVPRTRSV
jgi:hypothetical protein